VTTAEPVVCARCGRTRSPDDDPATALAWVSTRERGTLRWLCPDCARRHVRDIEGKLPDEYW
jgi:transposase-like protein